MSGLITLIFASLTTIESSQAFADHPFGASDDRRYDQNSYLGTHNAYASVAYGWNLPNQDRSISEQLDMGVRLLNLDIYLMRQYTEGLLWKEETYETCDTTSSHTEALEIALAHDPIGFGHTPYQNARFMSLDVVLAEIRIWMNNHPDQVVSILFERGTPDCDIANNLIKQAFAQAGYSLDTGENVFFLDKPNPGMMAPDQTNQPWEVLKHGFPTLREMVASRKRLVLLPDDRFGGTYRFTLQTVGGPADHFVSSWANPRSESLPPGDFTRPLFLMQNDPAGPALRPLILYPLPYQYPYNNFDLTRLFVPGFGPVLQTFGLEKRLDDIFSAWGRIPTHTLFDFFEDDASLSSASSGPMKFVSRLNQRWASMPIMSTNAALSSSPNANGWHNSAVQVTLSGSGDTIRTIVSNIYGAQKCANAPDCRVQGANSYQIDTEGSTTISFRSIGILGSQSSQSYVKINIDRQPPSVQCDGNISNYELDAPVAITCNAEDSLSGVVQPSLHTLAGAAYSFGLGAVTVPVTFRDYADNVTVQTVNLNVFASFASLDRLTRLFVVNIDKALSAKIDSAKKAQDRGNSTLKEQHLSDYINLLSNHIGSFVTSEHAAILIRAAQSL